MRFKSKILRVYMWFGYIRIMRVVWSMSVLNSDVKCKCGKFEYFHFGEQWLSHLTDIYVNTYIHLYEYLYI